MPQSTPRHSRFWTIAPVRTVSTGLACLAAFMAVAVLQTCRVVWACVADMLRDPSMILPPAQDFIVRYALRYCAFDIACFVAVGIVVVLLAVKSKPQLLLAYAGICLIMITAAGCYTLVCVFSVLFPLT